jgi:DNA primase large subunit
MKRCKAVESASSSEEVDVRIKLDRVNDQDADIVCLPEQLLPENEEDEEGELLLELHEQGMCMAPDMHSTYAIKVRAIKTLGIWTAAGKSPFPNLPNARLEEPCHVFSLRDVLDYGESMNVSIPFSTPKRPRIAASTVSLFLPEPDEDTIIRDVDLPAPSSSRDTIPLYELWYNRLCARTNADFPLPTLIEAEEALRLYCNAICLSMLSKQHTEALELLNTEMTDEQELLGYCLLWKAIAPGLEPIYAERFASADIALRIRRIELEMTKDHATLDAELDTIFKGAPRVGALLELETEIQMAPLNRKGCGVLKYRCAFENALRSVGKRMAVLSLGDAYMDAREATRVACELCMKPFVSYRNDNDTICDNVLRMALSKSSHGLHTLLNDDVTDWLRFSRDCVRKFLNNGGMMPGMVDPSHKSEALTQGPLCAFMLVTRLHETGHLEHEDRKMLLAILLDCGHTTDEAVDYVLQRMTADAKKKCRKTDLSALINSYCREKKTSNPEILPPVKVPATRWCSVYNSGSGIPVMCPWTLYKTDEKPLRHMLSGQKVEDIEDILAARTKYPQFPSFACKIHYSKLWDRIIKQGGNKTEHLLHPSKFRVVTPHAFVTGLFPIPPAVKQ